MFPLILVHHLDAVHLQEGFTRLHPDILSKYLNNSTTHLHVYCSLMSVNETKKIFNPYLVFQTHLVGILTRRKRSMAMASRDSMELWVMVTRRQEMKRQV